MKNEFFYTQSTDIPKIVHIKEMFDIWQTTFPSNIIFKSQSEFEVYLNNLISPTYHSLFVEDQIAGFLITFKRENNFWFIMSIATQFQNLGFGRNLIKNAKENHDQLFGWVVNKDGYRLVNENSYKSPILFYKNLGFTVNTNETFEAKGLFTVKIEWQKKISKED